MLSEEPKKVTGKFQRLSDKVNTISGKNWNGGGGVNSGSSSSSAGGGGTYTLTVEDVRQYLEKTEGSQETLWLFLLYLQIKSKIETGKSTNSLFSYFTNFLTSSTGGGVLV